MTRDELLRELLTERYGTRLPPRATAPRPERPRQVVQPVLLVLDDPDVIAERRRVLEQIDHHERTA